MIKILRTPAPHFLASETVTDARQILESGVGKAERQERLRFDPSLLMEVKADLLEMCNGKCAYCESKIDASRGEVDNFRPKAGARGLDSKEYAPLHYWWLAYEWENLLIACGICNQKYKRDYFPLEDESYRAASGAMGKELIAERALLINPTLDDPREHLKFEHSGIIEALSTKGKVTIEILGLNRTELVDRRKQEAGKLQNGLLLMQSATELNTSLVGEFVAYIRDLFSDTPYPEYAAQLRTIFDEWYEENASLWEQAKLEHSDYSQTKRNRTKHVSMGDSEAVEATAVVEQLTSLKRFSIKSVQIENFKSIEKLSLNIQPPTESADKESWLLLLGDNGIGKSSILQAIALALSTREQLDKLDLNVSTFLRRGTDKGMVTIQGYEHDKPISIYFDKDGFETDLNDAPTFVLAYGSTRLLPKGDIRSDTNRRPYFNIGNLFDYSIALNDPNAWLAAVDSSEFNDRIAPTFFDVLALRDDDKIWVDGGKISIRQYGDDHELENNSDGYRTITALVSDIMQTLSIDKANYHNSQGIVLIDEIGNHLHPRWRMKIVSALRKAFPKLQFIVTTHEPLCLRGLAHGEVVVLIRDQDDVIRALDKNLLPDHNLLRIDQLLTSDLFGLVNVMDEETEKTYEHYYALLSKPTDERTAEDETEIKAYSSKLSKTETLGSTPAMQAMFEVVNETYAQKIRAEGFKTKDALKRETITEVKDILSKKELDWL